MKKISLRRCVVTKEQLPKSDLLRIVKNKEGQVFPDITGKANGRGAYIKKDLNTLKIAKDKKILERALETKINDEVYEEIEKIIKQEVIHMMNVSEYASDVGKTVSEILKLCQRLNIEVSNDEDMLSDDDIIMLDNEIANSRRSRRN